MRKTFKMMLATAIMLSAFAGSAFACGETAPCPNGTGIIIDNGANANAAANPVQMTNATGTGTGTASAASNPVTTANGGNIGTIAPVLTANPNASANLTGGNQTLSGGNQTLTANPNAHSASTAMGGDATGGAANLNGTVAGTNLMNGTVSGQVAGTNNGTFSNDGRQTTTVGTNSTSGANSTIGDVKGGTGGNSSVGNVGGGSATIQSGALTANNAGGTVGNSGNSDVKVNSTGTASVGNSGNSMTDVKSTGTASVGNVGGGSATVQSGAVKNDVASTQGQTQTSSSTSGATTGASTSSATGNGAGNSTTIVSNSNTTYKRIDVPTLFNPVPPSVAINGNMETRVTNCGPLMQIVKTQVNGTQVGILFQTSVDLGNDYELTPVIDANGNQVFYTEQKFPDGVTRLFGVQAIVTTALPNVSGATSLSIGYAGASGGGTGGAGASSAMQRIVTRITLAQCELKAYQDIPVKQLTKEDVLDALAKVRLSMTVPTSEVTTKDVSCKTEVFTDAAGKKVVMCRGPAGSYKKTVVERKLTTVTGELSAKGSLQKK